MIAILCNIMFYITDMTEIVLGFNLSHSSYEIAVTYFILDYFFNMKKKTCNCPKNTG